jgi:micrococcal nuclease
MKKKKQNQIALLIFLIVLLITINYSYFDEKIEEFLSDYEYATVERVIDGDTFVIENKTSVRLLGINSPERGELYYNEAREFLEESVLNKTVKLEYGKEKYDQYKRLLAYIYLDSENINLELVREGFANYYFPSGKDIYYNEFEKAWEECINNNINLCEKSENKCAECIELKEFDYKKEVVIFHNKCGFDCELTEWTIKDEGRKNFIFPEFVLKSDKDVSILIGDEENNDNTLYWTGEEYVWTKTGDTLFLRDDKGKLVLWRSY